MIAALLLTAAFASSGSPTTMQTEAFFRARLGNESVLLTSTRFSDTKGYFLSYSVERRVLRKLSIDQALHDRLLTDFRKILNTKRRARLANFGVICSHPLTLREGRDAKNARTLELCLDQASIAENGALTKWWRQVRGLLRI